MLTSHEIRQQFIDFFVGKGHLHLPESSLVPENDPSVLLTTAGMQQFKLWFIKPELAKSKRVITIQPSFRMSDIEEVGDDTHLTLFEMMGNFSFGDYFKVETVKWWLDFLESIGIQRRRVVGTIFEGNEDVPKDIESFDALCKAGVSKSKIKLGPKADNFWGPTGTEGPCGPSIELYVDGIEIGTLVFNEYYSFPDTHLELLRHKGVDVGIGLERLAVFVQGVRNVYQTDEFEKIMSQIPSGNQKSRQIIADHIRGITFLIGDGILPSNIKQGYILRRLIRRATTHQKLLNAPEQLLNDSITTTIGILGGTYPKLNKEQIKIKTVMGEERQKFINTLSRAEKQFEKIKNQAKTQVLSGKAVFDLQSTYGLPVEITKELLSVDGFKINEAELKKELEQHQAVSRGKNRLTK